MMWLCLDWTVDHLWQTCSRSLSLAVKIAHQILVIDDGTEGLDGEDQCDMKKLHADVITRGKHDPAFEGLARSSTYPILLAKSDGELPR